MLVGAVGGGDRGPRAALAGLRRGAGHPPARVPRRRPSAKAIDSVQRALYLAISVGTAAVVAARWRAASPPGRRAMLPSVGGRGVPAALRRAARRRPRRRRPAAGGPALGRRPARSPWCRSAFLAGLLRSRLARGGLADLFGRLRDDAAGAAAGRARPGAARPGVHDRLPRPGRDASSTPTAVPSSCPGRTRDRAVATVDRDGARVAALVYDRSLDDDPELVEAVARRPRRSPWRTGCCRPRPTPGSPSCRPRGSGSSRPPTPSGGGIERNLHDGAQQRLVTLALQLALIQRRIRDDPGDAEQLVASASDELAQSLAELRELARGSTRPRSSRDWSPRSRRWSCARAVPARLVVEPGRPAAAAGRVRRLLRRVGGAGQRRQVRPGVGASVRVTRARTPSPSSRSPTTGSAAPTRPPAPGCAGSPTGSRRSAAGSGRRARPAAGRS